MKTDTQTAWTGKDSEREMLRLNNELIEMQAQADKLAAALSKCLSLANSFDATEREKKKHKGIYDKEHWIITETKEALAEYEAAQ
jgi:hypothetical protein